MVFFFDITSELSSWRFLKDKAQCGIWNHINEILVLCKNPLVYIGIWDGSFLPLHDSEIYWSFGKYWFTELCRSSKCWNTSLYKIKASPLLILYMIRNILSFGKQSSAKQQIQVFPQILTFAWKLKCYHLSVVFPWSCRFTHFQENIY